MVDTGRRCGGNSGCQRRGLHDVRIRNRLVVSEPVRIHGGYPCRYRCLSGVHTGDFRCPHSLFNVHLALGGGVLEGSEH